MKCRELCLLHKNVFGVVTSRTAQVQLAGSPSSEQDTMQRNPALTKLLLKPNTEHSSSPSFPKPERKGVTNSNSMSSEGRAVLLSDSTKRHIPMTASSDSGTLLEPWQEGAPFNKHTRSPPWVTWEGGSLTLRNLVRHHYPLLLPRLLCRHHACLCQEPAAAQLPRELWKLPCSHGGHSAQRDKRQNNTCWGITSFPQGWEKPCSALGNVPDGCSLSWQGRTQYLLTPSFSKAAPTLSP